MFHRTALGALVIAATTTMVGAQGLDADGAVDTIVGAAVEEQETTAEADPERLIAAIDNAGENARAVRMLTQAPRVDIVFLADATIAEGGPPDAIVAKLQEKDAEVAALRQEIEGNALLYHAIDSRQVLMRDVLAVEIGDDAVIVYAAAKPAG